MQLGDEYDRNKIICGKRRRPTMNDAEARSSRVELVIECRSVGISICYFQQVTKENV